jgi:hypothetical protein
VGLNHVVARVAALYHIGRSVDRSTYSFQPSSSGSSPAAPLTTVGTVGSATPEPVSRSGTSSPPASCTNKQRAGHTRSAARRRALGTAANIVACAGAATAHLARASGSAGDPLLARLDELLHFHRRHRRSVVSHLARGRTSHAVVCQTLAHGATAGVVFVDLGSLPCAMASAFPSTFALSDLDAEVDAIISRARAANEAAAASYAVAGGGRPIIAGPSSVAPAAPAQGPAAPTASAAGITAPVMPSYAPAVRDGAAARSTPSSLPAVLDAESTPASRASRPLSAQDGDPEGQAFWSSVDNFLARPPPR